MTLPLQHPFLFKSPPFLAIALVKGRSGEESLSSVPKKSLSSPQWWIKMLTDQSIK